MSWATIPWNFGIKAGAISGGLGVLLGAFGAHALQSYTNDPKMLATWDTASKYQLLHAGVLLLSSYHKSRIPVYCFIGGTLLFSGSLYLLVLTNQKKLGAITPFGGLLLTAGWFSLLL